MERENKGTCGYEQRTEVSRTLQFRWSAFRIAPLVIMFTSKIRRVCRVQSDSPFLQIVFHQSILSAAIAKEMRCTFLV
jgi:hypothetical protein